MLFVAIQQDYSKPCPQKQPTAEALAARTTAPNTPKPAAAAPKLSANINPPGSQPGRCNAYLPSGVSTLARYLWVVQYFVAEGFYVLVDYHPEPGNTEPVTDSVDVFANNWLRLYTAFTCLPNWDKELQGRVFFDLMNEPDGVGLTWDASKGGRKNLGDYYLASMDAIDKAAGGKGPIYFIQVGAWLLSEVWVAELLQALPHVAIHSHTTPFLCLHACMPTVCTYVPVVCCTRRAPAKRRQESTGAMAS